VTSGNSGIVSSASTVRPLSSDRLLIREFLSSDLDAFCQYVQSEHHWRSTPDGPPATERVEDLIKHFLQTQTNDPRAEFHLAAVDKFSNEFVGAVDLGTFAPWRQGTLGWGVTVNHFGQGLATEMGRAMALSSSRNPPIPPLKLISKCGSLSAFFTGFRNGRGTPISACGDRPQNHAPHNRW
jgi:hypothetical protein